MGKSGHNKTLQGPNRLLRVSSAHGTVWWLAGICRCYNCPGTVNGTPAGTIPAVYVTNNLCHEPCP